MNGGLLLYKKFIDGLIKYRESIEVKWVRSHGYPNTKENKKINILLNSLTYEQKEIIAEMLQKARIDGIHDTLAYMDEMSDLKSFTLSQYGEIYPMNIFESMHFDCICRYEGYSWPDE